MSDGRRELSQQVGLAAPVVLVNLAMMGMGVVDAIMVGHLSTEAFAAVSLGHAYLWCPLAFGIGTLLALDPLVSQARGAGDEQGVARSLQRGLCLALGLSVPIGGVLMLAGPVFRALGQPAEIIPDATLYAQISALGVPPLLVFAALRQTLQALGRLRAVVFVAVVANALNVLLDWAFIYGHLGLPRLGVAGCALATVLCQAFLAGALLLLSWPVLGSWLWPLRPAALALGPLRRLLALGVPIGVQLALEAGAFNAVTFLMGLFGPVQMAGHRVALTLASLSFMVPLGLSTAAAVRVGHGVGAGDGPATRRSARVALATAACIMLGFAALFLLFSLPLARVFSNAPEVVALAASLLPMAAAFQLFDGLQVVASGILRGTGDTSWPLVLNLLAYWVVGLPLGYLWGVVAGAGPVALWWSLGVSLACVATALGVRVRVRLARLVERIDLEDRQPAVPVELPVGER